MKFFKSSSKSKMAPPTSSLRKSSSSSSPSSQNGSSNLRSPTTSTSTTKSRTSLSGKPQPKAAPAEKVADIATHIEVCARIRPLQILKARDSYFASTAAAARRKGTTGTSEHSTVSTPSPDDFVAWDVNEEGDTAAQSPKTELIPGRTHSYTLDRVYSPESSTRDLYDNSIHSLVKSAMEGYHSSILAYGQTSTGKTFTMTGTKESPGLIPLCIRDCFRYVKECQESREYLIRVSYLEVYKEHIRDLLAPVPVPIRLFDGPNGLVIRGLKEEVVSTPERVFAILKQGEARRQVGATHMNQHSSRSHVMVRLWIESTPSGSSSRNKGSARVSSLSLVDLAGSESVRLNGTDRREEGQYINKSLMTLGQVVLSLSENKTGHIPYRDSKLTRLLQPSLSGNAQMVLLCCIHPNPSHIEESHNTFKFATRAKKIEQKAVVNTTPDEKTLLQNYREEIEDLKQQLAEAKKQQQQYYLKANKEEQQKSSSNNNNNNVVDDSAAGEVQELVQAIKTMEKLILKSHPHATSPTTTTTTSLDNMDEDDDGEDVDLLSDDNDAMDDLDLLLDDEAPPKTPERPSKTAGDDMLQSELGRIRGLLDSVLQQRTGAPAMPQSPQSPYNASNNTERQLDFSSPPRDAMIRENKEEVETLRKQLEQQELASNLRKADSSFLQAQLKEKDQLLEEVSKVLEAVEGRQAELEKENAELRVEVELLKARFVVI